MAAKRKKGSKKSESDLEPAESAVGDEGATKGPKPKRKRARKKAAKKSAAKKAATKKGPAKKAATKKGPAKKSATKKGPARKTSAKTGSTKKAEPSRSAERPLEVDSDQEDSGGEDAPREEPAGKEPAKKGKRGAAAKKGAGKKKAPRRKAPRRMAPDGEARELIDREETPPEPEREPDAAATLADPSDEPEDVVVGREAEGLDEEHEASAVEPVAPPDLQAAGPQPPPTEDLDGAAPVEDLDAVLDEELQSAEAVEKLIAETVAAAQEEESDAAPEPELLVLDQQPADEERVGEQPVDQERVDQDEVVGESVDLEPVDPGEVDGEPVGMEPVGEEGAPVEHARSVAGDGPGQEALVETVAPVEPVEEGTREVEDSERDSEPEPPADLGPISTPEARDRLLAQALAHSELQDARYRVPFSDPRRAGRWKGLAASVLFVIAGTLAVAPPEWVLPEPPAQLDAAERAGSIREALLLQAEQVEAFRVQFQRLPDTIDELPGRLRSVRFVKSGNRAYQLIAYEADGNAIVYDSSNPAPQFESVAVNWASQARSP